MIRGTVTFDAALFGDMVIAKNLESPLYNFAVVVDDHEMNITHVIRGEDHIANTPKQILMQRAFGFEEPLYVHLPLILGPDRAKLSKRYVETSLADYEERGFLSEATVNFLALLGWHPQDNQEIFTREDLIKKFDVKRVQKGGAIFNEEKLDWVNAEHIKALNEKEITEHLLRFFAGKSFGKSFLKRDLLKKIVHIEKGRLKNFADFFELAGFFFDLPEYDSQLLLWDKETRVSTERILQEVHNHLETMEHGEVNRESLEAKFQDLILKEGKGRVLWPLRVAVSGRAASPDPFDIIGVLGIEESTDRVRIALKKLKA